MLKGFEDKSLTWNYNILHVYVVTSFCNVFLRWDLLFKHFFCLSFIFKHFKLLTWFLFQSSLGSESSLLHMWMLWILVTINNLKQMESRQHWASWVITKPVLLMQTLFITLDKKTTGKNLQFLHFSNLAHFQKLMKIQTSVNVWALIE